MTARVIRKFSWGYHLIELASGRKIDLTHVQISCMIDEGRIKRGLFYKGKTVIILPTKQ